MLRWPFAGVLLLTVLLTAPAAAPGPLSVFAGPATATQVRANGDTCVAPVVAVVEVGDVTFDPDWVSTAMEPGVQVRYTTRVGCTPLPGPGLAGLLHIINTGGSWFFPAEFCTAGAGSVQCEHPMGASLTLTTAGALEFVLSPALTVDHSAITVAGTLVGA